MRKATRKVWVIAASPKEADELAAEQFGFEEERLAYLALRDIVQTADRYYSSKLKVYVRKTGAPK